MRGRVHVDSDTDGAVDAGEFVTDRVDPGIDFSWSSGEAAPGAAGFSGTWTGWVTVPATGTYHFGLATDDRARLELDGVAVVDVNSGSTVDTIPATRPELLSVDAYAALGNVSAPAGGVALTANIPHRVKLTYHNTSGAGHLALYMVTPTTPVDPVDGKARYVKVPTSWLTPDGMTLPAGWTMSTQSGFAAAYSSARSTLPRWCSPGRTGRPSPTCAPAPARPGSRPRRACRTPSPWGLTGSSPSPTRRGPSTGSAARASWTP
ncbi:MAG: hypothetical protein GEV08_13050 [Acidimicrobiia bacterium]|nr:hypothetical protein [Acidimicrobiia bacterium]